MREGAKLLATGREFAGLIYAHQLNVTIGRMVEDLVLISKATTAEEWRGRMEHLPTD